MRTSPTTAVLLACAVFPAGCSSAPPEPAWPIVYQQDFAERSTLSDFVFTDPDKWLWSDQGGRPSMELIGVSNYAPPMRSPVNIALLRDLEVADFDLDVDVMQTGPDYGHRDLCLFFGFESPQRFYYAHLATTPDPNAHNVFRVQDAPRTNLSRPAERGVDWGREVWHHVRIERRYGPGTIQVFWDGSQRPILAATCKQFEWGRIGLGSFDDIGRFANLVVRAPATRSVTAPADPFLR